MRKAFSALAVAAVGASMLALPAHAHGFAPEAQTHPDPYQIFANARAYWMQQRYPQALQYKVAVDITEGGNERVEHYDAVYDAVRNVVSVDMQSDYEREHPVVPHGINVGLLAIPLSKPLPNDDFLGVPHLAPTYSFGMAPFVPAPTPTPFNSQALVDEIRKEFHDPNPRKSAAPKDAVGLREIGSVVARNRDYSITLVDTQTIDGHVCYHLALAPTREPGKFRIREAWIDRNTFAPWQLKDASNFVYGSPTTVPWTIRFADIDGAHYISEERADVPMSQRGEMYTQASIRFENIVATTRTPAPDLGGTALDTLSEP